MRFPHASQQEGLIYSAFLSTVLERFKSFSLNFVTTKESQYSRLFTIFNVIGEKY